MGRYVACPLLMVRFYFLIPAISSIMVTYPKKSRSPLPVAIMAPKNWRASDVIGMGELLPRPVFKARSKSLAICAAVKAGA